MSQTGSSRISPWVWVGLGALVIAIMAVWGAVALRDLGGSAEAEPPTDEGAQTQEPDEDVIWLVDPSGASTETVDIWMTEPPQGFTLDQDTDASGLLFTSTDTCTIALYRSESTVTGSSDAEATESTITEIVGNLESINENLSRLQEPDVALIPVGEDGSGGRIELARFGVAYDLASDGTPFRSHTALRTFHDLDLAIQLTYTCPTADAALSFDDVLDSGLWFQP